jgi:hypothetical protein
MSEKPRLDRAIALARAHRELQQFGQNRDNRVHQGMTACTHTVCQFLAWYWKNEVLSLNQVNDRAGMAANVVNEDGDPRGMRPAELRTFLRNSQIPMVLKFDRPFERILAASDRGPVFYGMRYGSAPRRRGFGPTINGFARPIKRGATQAGAKDMRHAVLLLGYLQRRGPDGAVTHTDVFRKDPNHGSPRRPERPPFDVIFARQARLEYEDYRDKLGNLLYAAIPTRTAMPPDALNVGAVHPGPKHIGPPPGALHAPGLAGDDDDDLDPGDDDAADPDARQPIEPTDLGDDDDEEDPIPDGIGDGMSSGIVQED